MLDSAPDPQRWADRGGDGEYKTDVLVKLCVFREALVLVLAECKHQTRPVEREDHDGLYACSKPWRQGRQESSG